MLRGLALSLVLAGLFEFSPIAAAQSSGSPEPLDERRVYLPVEELDVVIDRDQRGVVLSRAEYEKLTAAARASAERFPPASQAVVLSRADYAAEIVEGQLVLDANVDFDQLRPGWQAVELPFRHVAVERAALDGKPARLGREGAERTLVLFSDQPGRHRLALKLSTPLASLGSDKVAAVGLAPAPAGSLRLSLPAGQFLHVDDLPLERPAAGDQPAEYAVAVGGKRELSVRITGRQAAQQSASLVFAATAIGLHVAPEERTWQAVTTLNVFGQPIDALQFQIPKSLEIVAVESTGLERWEIAPGPTQSSTTLKLVYRQPFAETRTVTFRGVSTSVLGQPWSVPTLGLTGATSHLVRVLVQHPAGLRLQPVEATSIRRVSEEEGEMQDLAASPDMEIRVEAAHRQHFAAWRDDFALLFVTQPRARELQATIATRLDIDSREIGLQASIMVQTRFAPLFELDLALPVEWTVSDVLVENAPARWRVVPVDAGSHRVRVTFAPPLAIDGKARLTLQARRIPAENWPIEDQTLEIPLPEVYLPDVGVTDGRYMVAADPDLDLVIADLTGLDPVRLSDQEQRLARAPRLAYEHQDTRFQGTLRVSRKPMRLAVQTLAFHRLDRELLASYLETRLYSQGGGVRTLEVALPDLTGTDLRFRLLDATRGEGPRPPEITEQTAAPAANGERVWTLQFDRRAFGLLWLVVDLQAPRTAEETSFSLPGLRIVGAERQSGQVVIEAGPEQQLAFEAFDVARAPLSEIDPADVLAPAEYVPRERIVAAYQTKRPGFSVALRETRFDRQAVPTAVCDRAVLATVIGAAGEMQHQASFALRATGVQSVRVELPHGAELWAAQIDGQPIEVRVAAAADGGAAAYLIPLPPTAQPAAVRRLQLDYQTATNRLTSSGTLGQTPPRLAVVSGQGETQPLEILERDWQVFHPAWTEITSSRGQFEPVQPPSPSSLLGRLQRAFQHEVTHDLQGKGSVVGVAFVLFGIAWLAGRRRGRRGVLAVTAAGGVMVLIGLVLTVTTAKAPFMYSSYETAAPADRMADGTVSFSAPGAKSPALDFSGGVSASGGRSSIAMDGELDASIAQDMPMSSTEIAKQSQDLAKEARTRHRSVGGASQDASSPPWGTITGALPNAAMPSDISDGVSSLAPRGKSTRLGQNNPFIAGGLPEGGHLNDEGEFIEALDQAAQPPLPPQREDQDGDAEPFVETVFAVQDAAAAAGAGIPQLAAANNAPTSLSRRQGARLSLAIQLEPEPGSRRTDFHYAGSPPGGVDPTLEIDYQQREGLSLTRLVWQAAVLLLFWLARHSSGGVRSTLAVFGLVFPLALLPIVPWDMLPHLDGLFLGTLCGLALWLALLLRGVPQRWRRFVTGGAPGMAALVLAAGLVWGSDSLLAQERPAAGAEPVPAADAESSPRLGRPTVVIPYDAGDDPTRGERFVLPFDRFLELWNAAHPDEALDRAAPRGGVVAEALYAVEVPPPVAGKPGTATLQGRLVLYNFRNEQLTLPIPLESVPITAASLNGQSAPLVTIDGAAGKELAVVLPSRGAHLLDVTITLPVEQAGHSGKVLLPLKPAPAGALRFTLPAADLTLKVEGGAGAFRRLQEGDKRVAIVPIDRGGPVTLNWAPAQAREGGEEIVHVESTTALQFTDAGMRIDASFQFVVRQGTLSEGLFGLPPGLLVRQIAGPDLGGWEITGEGEQRSLKVFLRRPVNDATTLRFDLFQALSIGDQPLPVGVPQFEPRGLTREVGTLGVSAERQLVVSAGPLTGLSQIDAAQFSKAGAQAAPPLLAYRFSARPFQLQLLVARQKPVSKGTSEHACYVGLRKQRLVSRLKLQLVGAPRSEIVVQLPPDYLLYDLKSLDASDYYVETPNDAPGPVLHIDLAAPRTGTIELVLDGIVPRQPEDLLPILSVPEPLGVGEMRSALAVWLDRSYAATIQSFDGWKTVDPETLPANLKGARQGPVQLAFTSSLTSLQPIALELKRAQARLGGEAVTVLLVRGTSVQYSIYLKWQISLAGEGTFVFTVPDWLANRMEIDRNLPGVRIRDVTSEKIAGNRVRLTVALEDPRDTGLLLAAHAVLPPPEDARIAAPTITFERIVTDESGRRIVPLESQRQFLVLVNQSQGRLDREGAAGSAVEAIPAQELPIRVGDEISNQAAEILAVRDPRATTTWTLQSTAALKALPASVNLAKLTLVLARDGSWRGEAAYRVNNRSRQFLALRMPAGARVLSLHVAGQAARPISPGRAADPGVLLVPLPKLSEGDQAVEIKLVSAGRFGNSLPQGLQVLRSELDLPAPQVLSQADDPDFGAPVAATEWTVVLPPDLDAKRIDDPDRTNVSESTEGAEELISWYQELLRLREEARRVGVRNNLAQLGTTVDNISQLESKVAAFDRKGYALQDERQARQVAELKQQWQSSANKSAGKVPSPATVQSKPDNPLSQKQVQGEIIRFNSDSFVSGGESDREYELRLELAEKPAETATAQTSPVPQKAAGKGTANRRALKGQTATQSLELNYANAAPQGAQTDEYWEEERYSKSPATDPLVSDSSGSRARNAGDADEILNADNGNNLRGIRAQGGGGFGFPVVQGRMGGASRGGGFGGGLGGGGQGGGGMGGGEPAQEGQGKGRANGPPQQPAAGGNRQRGGGRNEAGQADDFVLGSGQGSVWSQTGGLSLELTLPQEGQKLTFSKPGGDAKLALGLRPRVSQGVGMGLVWTIIWLALAVGAVRALGQSRRWERLQQWLPLSVTLLGLVWYFGLPGHTMGFLVFACGLVRLAWPRRSATT